MNITVTPTTKDPSRGILRMGEETYPCALGKEGITINKAEGDHKSPTGKFALRSVYYRYDKLDGPIYTQVPMMALIREDGWCDDPNDVAYNKSVMLPYHASAENLWRDDDLYDVLVVLGYNDDPVVPGKGSAIFMHVARDLSDNDFKGTEGCVSLKKDHLLELLPKLTPETSLEIINP
ncbi:L,D-transpeptidase family protein [Pseudemcibacter aquimaris]|uniref:L,D-transpeptidase family protein n=1 Tax=Pseudemcibacter aquimaris TaxID=2857064 RepID=UPI002012BD73|nr:L,D-transpeptidase family protein [Pseudemcibacter aquimaris]MCC3861671.1 L,D-transpeptidase family protein [Pseudemcibacter aquimaris]WDU58442.1 L,D-transpeptidase family protein [Pseudemcibacter aquimaris]